MRLVLQRCHEATVTSTVPVEEVGEGEGKSRGDEGGEAQAEARTREEVSRIGSGVVVFVGLSRDEDAAQEAEGGGEGGEGGEGGGDNDATVVSEDALLEWASKTILDMRLFEGESGQRWKESVRSLGKEVLLVSQFTLFGEARKRGRLDFRGAMPPDPAMQMFEKLVDKVRADYEGGADRVLTGVFGAYMRVAVDNDGPVTILVDSRNPLSKGQSVPVLTTRK